MSVTKTASSLTQLIKTMPMTESNVSTFRARAIQALEGAVDVFFKPEREVAEGKKAYDRLTDVESALRAYQSRIRSDQQTTEANLKQQAEALIGPEARTEELKNQPSVLANGKDIGVGRRTYAPSVVRPPSASDVAREQQDLLSDAVKQMGKVLPLYASVAMVPGPLSVSLKDHLHQSMQWKSDSQSSSSRDFQQESVRLLTLSAGKKSLRESSSSQSEGSGRAESVTVDERVMTGFQAIRGTLDGISFVEAEQGEMHWTQGVTETETVTRTTGWIFKKTHQEAQKVNSGYLQGSQQAVEIAPAHMALGYQLSDQGLKPNNGSDVVDLVVSAEQLTPQVLSQLQERGGQLIDQAVTTLFQTDREVSDGRKAYDGLANLTRSLRLADDKWAPHRSSQYWQVDGEEIHGTNLAQELHRFEKMVALYACVAMVPGEMSSSVKNFAKELATYHIAGSSSSSLNSRDVSGSLLTGALSVAEESGGSASSFSKEGRFETTTTDERIMPGLHRLRGCLEELEIRGKESLILPDRGNRTAG